MKYVYKMGQVMHFHINRIMQKPENKNAEFRLSYFLSIPYQPNCLSLLQGGIYQPISQC